MKKSSIKVEKTGLAQQSILKEENGYQFIDGYKSRFADPGAAIDIQQISKLFFSGGPEWLDKLFALRNRIVKIFGLKVPDKMAERLGLFKVIERTGNEVVLGEDDKHLDFRVSLLLEKDNLNDKVLSISTLVKFHNRMGRLYFIPVRPFHGFIVPAMLKGIIRDLKGLKY